MTWLQTWQGFAWWGHAVDVAIVMVAVCLFLVFALAWKDDR